MMMISNLKNKEAFKEAAKSTSVIIAAAGSGNRFSKEMMKLNCLLTKDLTVLEATLKNFDLSDFDIFFERIFLVLSNASLKQLTSHMHSKFFDRIERVQGGQERVHSVMNALERVKTPYVLIHDGARPLLSLQDLEKIVLHRGTLDEDGAILGTPVRDSLKYSAHQGLKSDEGYCRISKIVERDNLWQSLTPQIFPTHRLKRAMNSIVVSQNLCRDEAEAIVYDGGAPKIIQGKWSNLKMTYFEDLAIIKALYESSAMTFVKKSIT